MNTLPRVGLVGVEPTTSRLSGRRYNREHGATRSTLNRCSEVLLGAIGAAIASGERIARTKTEHARIAERIGRRVVVDAGGCWLWTGALNSAGYGQIRLDGCTVSVHRLVVGLTVGAMGAGDLACHRCDVRRCVNPWHLYRGDARSNQADRWRVAS